MKRLGWQHATTFVQGVDKSGLELHEMMKAGVVKNYDGTTFGCDHCASVRLRPCVADVVSWACTLSPRRSAGSVNEGRVACHLGHLRMCVERRVASERPSDSLPRPRSTLIPVADSLSTRATQAAHLHGV